MRLCVLGCGYIMCIYTYIWKLAFVQTGVGIYFASRKGTPELANSDCTCKEEPTTINDSPWTPGFNIDESVLQLAKLIPIQRPPGRPDLPQY